MPSSNQSFSRHPAAIVVAAQAPVVVEAMAGVVAEAVAAVAVEEEIDPHRVEI